MSHYQDELAVVAENREPIPFEEALRSGVAGKILVFISPRHDISEICYRDVRKLLPLEIINKCTHWHIVLFDETEIRFLTEYDVEHNALRGLGKVVWVR